MNDIKAANNFEEPVIPNGVLGMYLLIATEVMLFGGFISSYIVNKAGSSIAWPPSGQPRLPVEVTFVNTIILLLSAFTIYLAKKNLTKEANDKTETSQKDKIRFYLLLTALLGSIFLLIQGYEWVRLLSFGLEATSSLFAAFFYLIIGAHGLHVFCGLLAILIVTNRYKKNKNLHKNSILTIGLYWNFVVIIWPFLYVLVYII